MSNNQKQIAPLETITASTLMNTDYPPLSFSIEKLLPQGIFILAGSGKIGKSWLALDMCVAVSTGGRLWDFCATHGDVLYLALEDTHPRLHFGRFNHSNERVFNHQSPYKADCH